MKKNVRKRKKLLMDFRFFFALFLTQGNHVVNKVHRSVDSVTGAVNAEIVVIGVSPLTSCVEPIMFGTLSIQVL